MSDRLLAGCGKTIVEQWKFNGPQVSNNRKPPRRMLKKARHLTRPAQARQDAPSRRQGRSSAADPRFTFHASYFTVPGSEARMPHGKRRVSARLGGAGETSDFFSILLGQGFELWQTWAGMVNEGKQGRPTLERGTVHVLPDEMA